MDRDLFSGQANLYAAFRPVYPESLIHYVLQFVRGRQRAWDCATGNGQAAVLLADNFEEVYATDRSEKQLSLAVSRPNIRYSVASAEYTPFLDNSFDLVTIAQAYHWLSFAAFETEVKRVGRPGSVIAIWGYQLPLCGAADIDGLILQFYTQTVGPYWDAERRYVDEAYRTVPFHFAELPTAGFSIPVQWNAAQLTGYLSSWSSVQHFVDAKGYTPVTDFAEQLSSAWAGKEPRLPFNFPLFLRLGRIEK